MTLGPLLFAVEFPLLALSTIFVGLRFYCRQVIVHNLGLDDWIMLVALVNAWGIGVVNVFQVMYGCGTHMTELPTTAIFSSGILKAWYAYQMVYLAALLFVKISILAFYCRLCPSRVYNMTIKVTGVVVTMYTVAMICVNAFECPRNPAIAWSPTIFPKGCNSLMPTYYAQAGFNIFSDIVIWLLPLPSLLKLQVNRPKKIALAFIFSIGGIAVISSIVRINALYIYQHSPDVWYDGIYILLWSAVEINVAIISASAPSLRPFVKSIIGTTEKSGHAPNGYGEPQVHQTTRGQMPSLIGMGKDAEIKADVGGRDINESDESIGTKTEIV